MRRSAPRTERAELLPGAEGRGTAGADGADVGSAVLENIAGILAARGCPDKGGISGSAGQGALWRRWQLSPRSDVASGADKAGARWSDAGRESGGASWTDEFFQPVSGFDLPRFAGVPTFMRLPHVPFDHPRFAEVQIGLIGAPWDGGTTNRPGPRHGPRQLRDLSTMIRAKNGATWVAPFELARCADLGDVAPNPGDLMDSMARMEAFYARVVAAGIVPLTGGGRSSVHAADPAGGGEGAPGGDDPVRQPHRPERRLFRHRPLYTMARRSAARWRRG